MYTITVESVNSRWNDATTTKRNTLRDAIRFIKDEIQNELESTDWKHAEDEKTRRRHVVQGLGALLTSDDALDLWHLTEGGAFCIEVGDPTYEPVRYSITSG